MRAAILLLAISSVASAVRHAGISEQVALQRKSKSTLGSGSWVDDLGDVASDIAKPFEAVGEGIKDVAVQDYHDVKHAAEAVGKWAKKQFSKCNLCNDLGTVLGTAIQAMMDSDGVGEAESGAFATGLVILKTAAEGIAEGDVCTLASNDVVKPILTAIDNVHFNIDDIDINLSFNGSAAASCFGDICTTVWGSIQDTLGQDLAGVIVSMITEAFCGCQIDFTPCTQIFDTGSDDYKKLKTKYQSMPAETDGTYVTQNCERTYADTDYSPCGCSSECLNLYGENEGAGTCRQGCNTTAACSSLGCACAPMCVSEFGSVCPDSCGTNIWKV